MSEFESNSSRSMDFQLEMLIADVESKFIAAEDALSDLRHAVRQLKSYRPPASAPSVEAKTPEPEPEPYMAPVAQESPAMPENGAWGVEFAAAPAEAPEVYEALRPKLHEETVGIPFWPGPATAEPVEETKHVDENYGLDSTSEASWPIARSVERTHRPEPAFPVMEQPVEASPVEPEIRSAPQDADEDDDEARREEVARIVAQMRDGDSDNDEESSTAAEMPDEDDAEVKRRDVAKMVAELRDSPDVEAEHYSNGAQPDAEDDESRRQEVARMVAELRGGGLDSDETTEELQTEASEPIDDAEVRDEVRRAVEAARAEMSPGYKEPDEVSQPSESRFSFSDWQNSRVEPSGPPVIVIKDSEGRVELARVYETLSRVHCDENAALLNYTPHSVTIGLNITATVPEVNALSEAVKSVFGRACEVDSDGVRVNVQIGRDLKGKDSAA